MADTTPTPPKKPAARRAPRTGASTRKTAASAAKSATAKSGTTRKTSTRKPAASKAAAAKAVVASAPHNVAEKAKAVSRKAKDSARKSPFGLKTAIAAGVGTVGAIATAAILTLRGGAANADGDKPAGAAKPKAKKARQADGTDSSKSFEAGIADEGSIPHN